MATVDLIMPKMGESIMEATILKWHKKPGDLVKQDETVLEIATDKVDSEVPSTGEGIMEEILFKENDVVPIGTVIARIRTDVAETETTLPRTPKQVISQPVASAPPSTAPAQPQSVNGSGAKFYSPLVLNIAAQEGIALSELETISGSGAEGRVTKRDILQYVSDKRNGRTKKAETTAVESKPTPEQLPEHNREVATINAQPATSYSGNAEIIEMDRMRRLI